MDKALNEFRLDGHHIGDRALRARWNVALSVA
jgi:hypothetical protein